jgi:glycosyltransferase involved in cell wall biosynthesis
MNTNPLVSVIVLTYNQEHTIARTLDSILNQERDFPIEIIIGEDASTDNTRKVCEQYLAQYPDIITLSPIAPNKGVVKNHGDCLTMCKGKYLAGCAGDDWWHNPQKLKVQTDFLEKYPEYGVVYTDCAVYYTEKNITIGSIYHDTSYLDPLMGESYEQTLYACAIIAPTALYRRDLYNHFVDFDLFIQQGFVMEDYPAWLELQQHTLFKYLPICSMTYAVSTGSLCHHGENLIKRERFEYSNMLVRKYFLNKYPITGMNEKDVEEIFYRTMFLAAFFNLNKQYIDKYRTSFTSLSKKDTIKKTISKYSALYMLYRVTIGTVLRKKAASLY